MNIKRRAIANGLSAILALTVSSLVSNQVFAHGASVGALRIDHPYAMPSLAGANQWIVYFRDIKNEGATPDRLVNASTPIAAEVIIEKVLPPLGSDKVFAMTSIELPAKSTTPMRHNLGGYRLLLKDLKQPIKDGDRFELTMTFEHAGSETVKVYVQSAYKETPEEHKH
jgi:copper(I)-binding protein